MGRKYQGPLRLAHRGMVQAAPENTMEAFRAAHEAGLEGVEIDVRLTADGEVAVIHDANLTRLTLGHPTGASNACVADLSWEALSKVEFPYANHLLDPEPPPGSENETLAIQPMRLMGQQRDSGYEEALLREPRMASPVHLGAFFRWLAGLPRFLVEIEVKAGGAVRPILDLMEKANVADRCILFSGEQDYIEEIQRTCGVQGKPEGLRLGANIRSLTPEWRERIPAMDLYEVGLNAGCMPSEDLAWLGERGVGVFSNLGDYPAWWRELSRLRPEGLKTNYAGAFTGWWQQNAGRERGGGE